MPADELPEPDDKYLVLLGSLRDNDPEDMEVWARDDEQSPASMFHWCPIGRPDRAQQRTSWRSLLRHAARLHMKVTLLGTGAR